MKVTSPVLRGERGSNASDLPDQLAYPGSALVLLDYIAGDFGVNCIVRNKYITINEEDYNEAV